MNDVVCTLKSNMELDENGEFQFDDEGELLLKDNDDVGVIAKTHVIPLSQVDKDGNIMAGFISRVEVYWDKRRNPSPDMLDPSDLVWLSIVGDDDDAPETDEPDENQESDEIAADYEEAV